MTKVLIFATTAIVLVLLFGFFIRSKGGDPKSLSNEAHKLVQEGAILLDVRTPAEFSEGHAEGAINIPVDELPKRLSEIPKNKEVVTYCKSGRRSGNAAQILKEAGYKVFDLQTFSNWKQ